MKPLLAIFVAVLVGCGTVHTDYGKLYLTESGDKVIREAARNPDGRNTLMMFAIFIGNHTELSDRALAKKTAWALEPIEDRQLTKALFEGTKRAAKSRDPHALKQYAFEIESYLLLPQE